MRALDALVKDARGRESEVVKGRSGRRCEDNKSRDVTFFKGMSCTVSGQRAARLGNAIPRELPRGSHYAGDRALLGSRRRHVMQLLFPTHTGRLICTGDRPTQCLPC